MLTKLLLTHFIKSNQRFICQNLFYIYGIYKSGFLRGRTGHK